MYRIGDNIISSLGFTTEENFNAVKAGVSGVKHYDAGTFNLPEAFMASLIDKEKLKDEFASLSSENNYTNLEKATILSVYLANKEAQIDLSSDRTIFILSTTKGNVELLDMGYAHIYLWHSAGLITGFFNNPNTPIIVSNACISGAAAQITAMRELQTGNYDYAVVMGVDFLSKFIISGFQSFKALSAERCRPFDKDRCGLNLGEAAATIIFSKDTRRLDTRRIDTRLLDMRRLDMRHETNLLLVNAAIRNDANHISAPSRTGEGSYRALNYILNSLTSNSLTSNSLMSNSLTSNSLMSNSLASNSLPSQLSFINAHGTATPYNDAMEVTAIVRAGLEQVPVNSLKPFFGHTLGAAGVLESIISMRELEENRVLKSPNFIEQDFENHINISKENHFSDKKYCIKMLSGFGGVNAALLFCNMRCATSDVRQADNRISLVSKLFIKKHIKLSFKNAAEITGCYRSLQIDYPKFFKMDGLSKLGFLASEMIFKDDENRFTPNENIVVICFNRSASLDMDMQYLETIRDNENYFPSPSLFVYTLPNIVTGEIAIRNHFFGETSCYICKEFNAKQIFGTVRNVFRDTPATAVLVAWIEYVGEKREVVMLLVESRKSEVEFTEELLKILYNT